MIKRLLQTERLSRTAKRIFGTHLPGRARRGGGRHVRTGFAALTAVILWATCSFGAFAQAVTIDIDNPGSSSGTGWTFSSPTLTITANGEYTVTGTGSPTTNRIAVQSGKNVRITLQDVNIDVSGTNDACAFDMTGATVYLTLRGTNVLRSGRDKAGLQVPAGATLEITAASTGSLEAASFGFSAGIGGGSGYGGGAITISGGTVTAYSTGYGAGIGGGYSGGSGSPSGPGGDGGTITISGGTVNAYSSYGNTGEGAGIGGGYGVGVGSGGPGGTITIYGGTVNAYSSYGDTGDGAGIGGSRNGPGGTITIYGGTVTAYSSSSGSFGFGFGAGIGGGQNGNGGNIKIFGGTVEAYSFYSFGGGIGIGCGAGIGGGGNGGDGGTIAISGGTVEAYSSNSTGRGAGIGGGGHGGGGDGGSAGTIEISGGTVTATGGTDGGIGGAGIGGGAGAGSNIGGDGGDITVSGGTVTATGGTTGVADIGAGSGGSSSGADGTVTVTGGSLNAPDIQPQPIDGASNTVYLNTLTVGTEVNTDITAGSISGTPCTPDGTGGYGINDVTTDTGGKVYLWLTETSAPEPLELTTSGGKTYSASYTRPNSNSASATLPFSYGISLSPAGTCVFPSAAAGYAAVSPQTVTVTNDGPNPTGPLTAALSSAGAFTLSPASWPDISAGGSTSFTVAPVTGLSAGTYTATVTVAGDHGISASFNVSFTVTGKPAPTAGNLDFDLTPAVYTGERQGIAAPVPKATVTGLGDITAVKYRGTGTTVYPLSATPPVNAGTYAVTVDIAEGTDYAAATNLSLGTLSIARAAPTADVLDFDLSDVYYAGERLGIDTPTVKHPYTGLGALAVTYNGQDRLPDIPGTYTVTLEIGNGVNFTAATFVLGTFTIHLPPYPSLTRQVTLPAIAGVTTTPPAGLHALSSGHDFKFIIHPSAVLAGLEPAVTTGRETDDQGGVTRTLNDDGSYTVIVRAIHQDIELHIALVPATATGTAAVSTAAVWSSGNRIYISAVRTGQARIYSLTGTLVKTVSVHAGETAATTLPAGVYIVALNGIKRKVVVSG
ncbi:MAG: hypothetical protein LBP98_03025 [Tannerella sp.]|jgi:hypothetical protein|nr:hypothetical protein [Tannerella sp.]